MDSKCKYCERRDPFVHKIWIYRLSLYVYLHTRCLPSYIQLIPLCDNCGSLERKTQLVLGPRIVGRRGNGDDFPYYTEHRLECMNCKKNPTVEQVKYEVSPEDTDLSGENRRREMQK